MQSAFLAWSAFWGLHACVHSGCAWGVQSNGFCSGVLVLSSCCCHIRLLYIDEQPQKQKLVRKCRLHMHWRNASEVNQNLFDYRCQSLWETFVTWQWTWVVDGFNGECQMFTSSKRVPGLYSKMLPVPFDWLDLNTQGWIGFDLHALLRDGFSNAGHTHWPVVRLHKVDDVNDVAYLSCMRAWHLHLITAHLHIDMCIYVYIY